MHASVVLNRRSSQTAKHIGELPDKLRAVGVIADTVVVVDEPEKLERSVKRFIRNGAKVVLVGGGDGSIAQAVNALAYKDVTLGVLPFGTGNSFAQTLGIEPNIDAAVAAIAGQRTATVDLGRVNKRYFANFATIGLPAEIANTTPHGLKGAFGAAAYAIAGVKPFLTHRPFRASVRYRGGKLKLETQQIIIASGRVFGKQPLTPDASITDGKLSFFTTSGVSYVDLARAYVAMGLGLGTRLPDAHTFRAKRIDIRAIRNQPISIDGNPAGKTPARFRIAESALRVFVPATFDDERA